MIIIMPGAGEALALSVKALWGGLIWLVRMMMYILSLGTLCKPIRKPTRKDKAHVRAEKRRQKMMQKISQQN